MKLKNKLKLYESYIQAEANEIKEEVSAEKETVDIPNREEWQKIGVIPYLLDNQYCFIKEKRISIHEKRGIYFYKDFLKAIEAWQQTNIQHPLSAKGYAATDLFFFDTETTGLGGGTGNTIFLLGYCYVDGEEIVVKQHLLPEPGFEIPLYDSFLKSIDYTTLVTYNGKAFDWPQVKTRHTLIREHVPKLPAFGHFDLLHASRRLWKNQLDSVKLSIVEKEILGIKREDDVPGFLAPIIYFDFVESKNMEGIVKIMEHNEDDVLSLLILYTHITNQLLGLDLKQSGAEKLSVGYWLSSLNETEAAVKVLEEAIPNYSGRDKWKGMHELAALYKKMNNYHDALSTWSEVIEYGMGIMKIEACIESAKIYEHHYKNYISAYELTKIAIEEFNRSVKLTNANDTKLKGELRKRIERLNRKMGNCL